MPLFPVIRLKREDLRYEFIQTYSIWENARRMRVLEDFRNNVISYFNNSSPLALGDGRSETPEAVKARQRINLGVNQAHLIIEAAGVTSIVQWSPPPLIGGDAQRITLD